MSDRDLPDLRRTREGTTLVLTLDRPDARNAYSDAMVDSLVRALEEADRDDALRCIIITGAGAAFSAGGDLKRMLGHEGMFAGGPAELRRRYIDGIQRIPRRFALAEKPIVAAINGPAIGAGLDLACMCDLRVAARGAQLGSTFVKVGLVPGDGGAYLLGRTVGFPRALEMMMTARLLDTEEAERIGLVHRVVEPAALMETAHALAEQLAALPPLALRLTKRAAYRSFDADLEHALELAATYQGVVQNTDDHHEAVRAMLERRPPKFTGP